jgi:uncharacterized membrane protein
MKAQARERKLIALLVAALAWCGALIVIRAAWTKNFDYGFLVWNLGLASAPILFSTLAVSQARLSLRLFFGFLWLLFLPNAPYLITDFIHIRVLSSGPIWLDVLMLSSCAATGLAMGYCSVIQIHKLFNAAGKPVLGWTVAISAMFLSGFGIYLGRFLRWRTIDIAHDPFLLLTDVAERLTNPFVHYRAWAVTLGFGVMLSIGYAFLMLRDETRSSPHDGPTTPLCSSGAGKGQDP